MAEPTNGSTPTQFTRHGPVPPRRCAEPGCITLLNSWHDSTHCYAHEDPPKSRAWGTDRELLAEIMEEALGV